MSKLVIFLIMWVQLCEHSLFTVTHGLTNFGTFPITKGLGASGCLAKCWQMLHLIIFIGQQASLSDIWWPLVKLSSNFGLLSNVFISFSGSFGLVIGFGCFLVFFVFSGFDSKISTSSLACSFEFSSKIEWGSYSNTSLSAPSLSADCNLVRFFLGTKKLHLVRF